jgi:feruloyl esterase
VLLAIALAIASAVPERCAAAVSATLGHARVEKSEVVDGDICKITGMATPVAGSHIRFELRLPPPNRWSGRYYQIGNGGFGGAIHEPTLVEGAARGDAIAATDTGHVAGAFDASWARGHPVQVDDYGWRSIKATSDAARALIRAYYGRRASHHYAIGCSNGGRMALMAAARWPSEWDGVIAGAPANPWTDQLRSFYQLQHQLRSTPKRWIDPKLLTAIKASALEKCPVGTIEDGVPLRPTLCGTDFSDLRCSLKRGRSCLTSDQISSLEAITGAGYLPAAMIPEDWQRWILAPTSAQSQLTFADQAAGSLSSAESVLNVPRAGLVSFLNRGGKILSYAGWADAVIAPTRILNWYRSVTRASGGRAARNYQLFMVPGMIHCQGGFGATSFGQSIETPGAKDDAAHDIRRSLEAWVEAGHAPRELIATDQSGARSRTLTPARY